MKTLRSVNPLNRSRCRSAVAVAVNSSLLTLICAATLAAHADCFAAQSGAATVTLNGRDLSGDGIADSVIATPWIANTAGIVDVFDGATGALIVQFTGLAAGDGFGASLAFTGDLNSDGLPEVLIGAPGSQRAYLAMGPFADVSDPAVSASRLNHELASPDGTTVDFGFDVAGLYDFDGDTSPDLRVAAHVTAADGTASTKTFIFNGVTGGLIGTCERAPARPTIERAVADTDLDAKVTVTDLATVFENLGATEADGATSGDVTGDGVVDGADVGLVGSSLGNELYGDVIATDAGCPAASVSIQAIDETVCVHAENTTVLAAELVDGVVNPVDPADIIHPNNNECGERIRACLTNPRVIEAVQLVAARCWPGGVGPPGVIGRIYCAPCNELQPGTQGYAGTICIGSTRQVTITICSGSNINDCEVLAHELTHISQYCAMGLFSLQSVSCDQFEAIRRDPRNAICRELEAYRTAGQCDDNPATPLSDCCTRACGSAARYWQGSVVNCQNCCKELSDRRCCDHGFNECEHPVACVGGGSHAP
jgi:FG-GAP repeat